MFTIFGFTVAAQAFWLYVIIGGLVFLGLDVTGKSDGAAVFWRFVVAIFHPVFWFICAVRKL